MKIAITTLAVILFAAASGVGADRTVKGYTTKKGTYVAPHTQTAPDKSKLNNYSTKGNANPYTGKNGTVDPFKVSPTTK